MASTRYAKPGENGKGIRLYQDVARNGVVSRKAVRQALWGDWLNIREEIDGWGRIAWGDKTYWVKLSDTQAERPLEIIFVDVGQGDGCFIAAPHADGEKWIVVDAGADSNMSRFLSWRFRLTRNRIRMHAAVITHSDEDHYGGFQPLFAHPNLSFDRIYHNGLAERAGDDIFGPVQNGWLTDLPATQAELKAIYDDPAHVYNKPAERKGAKRYPTLMRTALEGGRVGSIEMLSTATGTPEAGRVWMRGFAPSDGGMTIEVLGPVVEPDANGRRRLRTFGNVAGVPGFVPAKTKNGHSILLRLSYGEFSLLLGGDLNRPSEDFLLRHYGEIGPDAPLADAVPKARQRLRADLLKSCHHGSADVTDEFLQAVQPFAFVVSSGEEGYAHPRPDLLGRLGRHGRGEAPLILCTEILRSTREREDSGLLRRIQTLDSLIENPATTPDARTAARKERTELQTTLGRRNVEVYGAITLRTDGDRMVVAFRHEKPKQTALWQTFWYENRANEGFVPIWRSGGH